MKLSTLIAQTPLRNPTKEDPHITGIFANSTQVIPGGIFVALSPHPQKRATHITQAIAFGAAALVVPEEDVPQEDPPILLVTSQGREIYAQLAAQWYHHPGEQLTLIGVTGTNGKTTTTHIIKSMLEQVEDGQPRKVGLIGTNENKIGSQSLPAHRTTPDALELQALLHQMKEEGCTHVVMEVSSHGLVQGRTHGLRFAVGIFTNLTQDHLDYHHTMEDYRRAKGLLFPQCDTSIFNLDDPVGVQYAHETTTPYLTYAEQNSFATLTATNIALTAHHTTFHCQYQGTSYPVSLPIPGGFSLYNALAALTCGIALHLPLEQLAGACTTVTGVKGRIEVVPNPSNFTVIIDYAHTPNALENILSTASTLTNHRLICLFGCGGNRDKGKRPLMGAIAQEYADLVVVTSDNPREEDPQEILQDILEGMDRNQTETSILVESNRKNAIFLALSQGQSGDVVVLAGKGHECYQEVKGRQFPLDEREIVAEFFHSFS